MTYLSALLRSGFWVLAFVLALGQVYGQDSVLVTGEYFFGLDPGYGNASPITFSTTHSLEHGFNVPTSGLSAGMHLLYIRLQEQSGKWGIPFKRMIVVDTSGQATSVQGAEYFYDEDPGYGNGTPIAVSNATEIENQTSLASNLSVGFHLLHIRVVDDGGTWSIPLKRLVFVDSSGQTTNIQSAEYFYDEDPGYGQATPFSVSQTHEILDQRSFAADLAIGFHLLHVRVKDDGGIWSIPLKRLIFVDSSGVATKVSQVEYFFDQEPGPGNGTKLNLTSVGDTVQFNDQISTTDLSIGFHLLHIRCQDNGGVWGIPFKRMVFVDPSGAEKWNISAAEYFFDQDPGYGQGTVLSLQAANDINFLDHIETEGLSLGMHLLYVRVQDENGIWSLPLKKLVVVDGAGGETAKIARFEHYLDSIDPGYGSGTVTEIDPTEELDSLLSIELGEIDSGLHTLFIRPQTEGGMWGTAVGIAFKVEIVPLASDSAAIRSLYDSLGGISWTKQVNWLNNPYRQWTHITFDRAGAVLNIDLSNAGLTGIVPSKFYTLSDIDSLKLRQNNLSGSLGMDSLRGLDYLDISSNNYEFKDLQPIPFYTDRTDTAQAKVVISPQKDFGTTDNRTYKVGTGNIEFVSPITVHEGYRYYWIKGVDTLSGPSFDQSFLFKDQVGIGSQESGIYHSLVKSDTFGNLLTLRSAPINVDLYTSISGHVVNEKGDTLKAGHVILMQGQQFDTVSSFNLATSPHGEYLFEPLPLFTNYYLQAYSDDTVYVPTYWSSALLPEEQRIDWKNAGIVYTDTVKTEVDIFIVGNPPSAEVGRGVIKGIVEGKDEPLARILARKRIASAGVVLSKQVGTQRTDGTKELTWKVVAYIKTDELGQFQFNNLPDGKYRLQIQYPGVPMDENAQSLEIDLKEGVDNEAVVSAKVEETGFILERLDETPDPGLTAVTSSSRLEFLVYPNPCTDHVQVFGNAVSFKLQDLYGKTVLDGDLPVSGIIKVKGIKPGVYILELVGGKQDVLGKVKLIVQ